ncbi:MAG TPA: hypothetical protein PKE21_04635 [Flavobacteriales bacterium]|nr:hypothetical protein [Flavobacteriales bacterium]HMR26745.1 hypothetical protein [Flavobacteriales bacterium]
MQKVDDKRYKRIQDLVKALIEAERALEKGGLNVAGLEQACDDARELYERLVVLRHKAREGERPHPPAAALALAAEPPAAKPKEEDPPKAPAPLPAPVIRLDTRAEIRQTSLIDAIAETESAPVRPRAGKPASGAVDRPKSVADKLGEAPIPDLSKAIALSQKFWFVAELFGGDRVAFEQGVEAINTAADGDEARRLVKEQLGRLKKAPDPEALQAFLELVERRHR